MDNPMICCSADYKVPPTKTREELAENAIRINPNNTPGGKVFPEIEKDELALLTATRWSPMGVILSVSFIDEPQPAQELRNKIVRYMNKWGEFCNVRFNQVSVAGQVRISLIGSGHWSFIGTDIESIPLEHPTMNLEKFSLDTADSEFERVVLHETGHTLGFTHEHLRQEIVEQIEPEKAYEYYGRYPNFWSRAKTNLNVLTPIQPNSYRGTVHADTTSIMCYSIPREILKENSTVVLGGETFDRWDRECAAQLYPIPGNMEKVSLSSDNIIKAKDIQADRAGYLDGYDPNAKIY